MNKLVTLFFFLNRGMCLIEIQFHFFLRFYIAMFCIYNNITGVKVKELHITFDLFYIHFFLSLKLRFRITRFFFSGKKIEINIVVPLG